MKELKEYSRALDRAIDEGHLIKRMVEHEATTQRVLVSLISESFNKMQELAAEQVDNMMEVDAIVKSTTSLYANFINERDASKQPDIENVLDMKWDVDYTSDIATILEKIEQCRQINCDIRDDILSVRQQVGGLFSSEPDDDD